MMPVATKPRRRPSRKPTVTPQTAILRPSDCLRNRHSGAKCWACGEHATEMHIPLRGGHTGTFCPEHCPCCSKTMETDENPVMIGVK